MSGVWDLPEILGFGIRIQGFGAFTAKVAALQNLEGRSGCWSWDFGRIKASAFRVSNSGQGLLSILFQLMFILLTFTNSFRYPDLLCAACRADSLDLAGSGLK